MISLVSATQAGSSFSGPTSFSAFMTLNGLAVGDIVLASVGVHSTVNGDVLTPAGWTLLNQDTAPLIRPQVIFWKLAEAATEVFDLNVTRYVGDPSYVVGAMVAYTGVDPQNPIYANNVTDSVIDPIAPSDAYDLTPAIAGLSSPANGMLVLFLGYSTFNVQGYGDFGISPTITLPAAYPGLTQQALEQLAEQSVQMRAYDQAVGAGAQPADSFSLASTNTNMNSPGRAQSVLGQVVLQPKVFVGTPIIEQISDSICRITGISLTHGTTGTIGLAARSEPAEITLPAGFKPIPDSRDGELVDLVASIDVSVKPTNTGGIAIAVPVNVVKTGGTPETWTASITNPHAGSATNSLEIYVKFGD